MLTISYIPEGSEFWDGITHLLWYSGLVRDSWPIQEVFSSSGRRRRSTTAIIMKQVF